MVADTLRSPITPSESALGPAAGDRETMEPVCHHTKLYTCLYSHSQIISLQPPPPPHNSFLIQGCMVLIKT